MAGALSFAPESVAVLAHAAKPAVNTKIRKILGIRMLPFMLFVLGSWITEAFKVPCHFENKDTA